MRLEVTQQIIGLPVKTAGGMLLGKVREVEIDSDRQMVSSYYVRSLNPLTGLFRDSFVIHRSSVISLTNDALIIPDSFVAEEDKQKNEKRNAQRFVVSTPKIAMERGINEDD